MGAKLHQYEGQSTRVTYDAKRCIHAAECVHGLPDVFDPKARPWVNPDAASAEELAAVVARCPTGALRLTRLDGGPAEETPTQNTVTIDPNGPLYVHGDVQVVDAEGAVVTSDLRIALCRCGASTNKPFCDGKHAEVEFEDSGAIPAPQLRDGDAASGQLKVTLAKNGPLILDGPLTLQGGEDTCSGSRGALCRCGASANKPFCDGAHAKIGFSDA
ncbi:MAG: CDGSH iron-sulfur domain-containing protein [Acidobacteriota bacterium]